jgi:hypothetical protein
MSDDIRFELDDSGRAVPVDDANGFGSQPAGAQRPGMTRGRKLAIASVAATVVTLGGGAVALATTQHSGPPAPGGYGAPGYGPEGGFGAGGPGGYGVPSSVPSSVPSGVPSGGTSGSGQTSVAHKPQLAGKVKSVSSTTITVTDGDGFTRTINITSSTKYSGGLTAAPTVGTQIHAVGTVNSDGVSLDATSITKGGGFGGGPGRPGGS